MGIHDVGVQVSVSGGGYSRDCGSPGDGFSFTALLVNISDTVLGMLSELGILHSYYF